MIQLYHPCGKANKNAKFLGKRINVNLIVRFIAYFENYLSNKRYRSNVETSWSSCFTFSFWNFISLSFNFSQQLLHQSSKLHETKTLCDRKCTKKPCGTYWVVILPDNKKKKAELHQSYKLPRKRNKQTSYTQTTHRIGDAGDRYIKQ